MFKVHLTFTIYSRKKGDPENDEGSTPFAWAEREIELLFPPFIGLRFDSKHDRANQSITHVTWRTNYFNCQLESEYPRFAGDYDDLKIDAVERGWTVKEVLPDGGHAGEARPKWQSAVNRRKCDYLIGRKTA